ncbi:MAG: fibronectin type III domain-containing protein [Methylobacter sp.]|uniref:fibronectin type III domain-containing protein n=1 Tax=Methylicorpusculum sp. TaxID=2713644 RepID=UPI00272F0E93|nr:fibronectin type III domain-containing protein [Methylicorpusculum sp.]MDP2178442.1 fibronectin type III domain-containing protein [Methylicorpusculum sp.]MDZ4218302.1 fibronectin type III domain-containing protein [Methylobacter sp.]
MCNLKLKSKPTNVAFLFLALSGLAEVHAADQLFKSDFRSDTVLYPPRIAYSTAGWQDLAGTNLLTGKVGPVAIRGVTESGFDMIADTSVTLSTLSNYMTNEIQQVTGPDGNQVHALFQNLKKSNAAGPTWGASQNSFMLMRGAVNSGDKTDTGDVYYSYWFKFQPDLRSQLGTTGNDNWRVMSEWKTGGLNNTWKGDYRIITHVLQDSSGRLSWNTQGDNVANGISTKQIYWQVTNTTVPVPVGEWFKYEVFWHRSSGSDGRYWAAVNGQVIADHKGSNMGIYNLPINRIMLTNAYSGGKAPIQQWLTGLEIWNGFPCGVGVSCYGTAGNTGSTGSNTNAADTIAPSAPASLSATASSTTKVELSWNAATDNVGVTGYKVYRNGTEIGTTAAARFTDASVVADTTYSYAVKAYDAAGNLSASSNTATVKTALATVSITSYYAGSITANSARINWTTNSPSTGVVYYGTNSNNLNLRAWANTSATSQSVQLTGLNRRTTYYYRISADNKSVTGNFRTPNR